MVLKADLCEWFKGLHARKRIDYMCGLLHMCLPLELRFIGTVLEDLAKKDFNYLRDAETKANTPSDLANVTQSLADRELRAKIHVALALMRSTNSACANKIFTILERQLNSTLHELLSNRQTAEEINSILTLAAHHPAFQFYQRQRLSEALENIERQIQELFGNDIDDPDLLLPVPPAALCHPSLLCSRSPVCAQPEKVSLTLVEIKGTSPREGPQNKKTAIEFKVHAKWSNGDVTEKFMKYKELQDLHHKLCDKFPEEKKQRVIPVFPGKQQYNNDSLKDKMAALNAYLRDLMKTPVKISDCDVLTESIKGSLLYHPHPLTGPIAQPFFFQYPDEPGQMIVPVIRYASYQQTSPSVATTSCSAGPSQGSSTANSPCNSRTSSPAPPPPFSPSSRSKKGGVIVASAYRNGPLGGSLTDQEKMASTDSSLTQLLKLLSLEKYADNLNGLSVEQILSMGSDDFSKLGLPQDARVKLHNQLEQLKHNPRDINGLINSPAVSSSSDAVALGPSYHMWPVPQQALLPLSNQAAYMQHPFPGPPHHHALPPSGLLASPRSHLATDESSPANSESSPSHSPALFSQSLNLEAQQTGPVNTPAVLMTSPPNAHTILSQVKGVKNAKQQDSSGSEDNERNTDQVESVRNRGPGRPVQSTSLPLITSTSMTSLAVEEGNGAVMSLSAPHSHPSLVNIDSRTDGTPPPSNLMVNGYIPDPPPLLPQGPTPVLHRHHMGLRPFKSAQPTHTAPGMHKNVINMPGIDLLSHPPQSLGKNGGGNPAMHAGLSQHPYPAPPNASSVSTNQVMGAVNVHGNHSAPHGHMPPSLVSDGGNSYPLIYPTMHIMQPPRLGGSGMPPPRSILTTVANSTVVMTTTQSHSSGVPPPSHSPSPVASTIPPDSIMSSYAVSPDAGPPDSRLDGTNVSPPSQTPPTQQGSKLPPTSGPNSGTPSPPLGPPPSAVGVKSLTTNTMNCETSLTNAATAAGPGQQHMYIQPHMHPSYMLHPLMGTQGPSNGLVHPISQFPFPHHQQGHHQPPHQHFAPNGITPEMYLPPRFQYASPAQPFMYGNNIYATLTQTANPNSLTASNRLGMNPIANNGNASGKSVCYNCGLAGHKAVECKDPSMENIQSSFQLNYEPKSESE